MLEEIMQLYTGSNYSVIDYYYYSKISGSVIGALYNIVRTDHFQRTNNNR